MPIAFTAPRTALAARRGGFHYHCHFPYPSFHTRLCSPSSRVNLIFPRAYTSSHSREDVETFSVRCGSAGSITVECVFFFFFSFSCLVLFSSLRCHWQTPVGVCTCFISRVQTHPPFLLSTSTIKLYNDISASSEPVTLLRRSASPIPYIKTLLPFQPSLLPSLSSLQPD